MRAYEGIHEQPKRRKVIVLGWIHLTSTKRRLSSCRGPSTAASAVLPYPLASMTPPALRDRAPRRTPTILPRGQENCSRQPRPRSPVALNTCRPSSCLLKRIATQSRQHHPFNCCTNRDSVSRICRCCCSRCSRTWARITRRNSSDIFSCAAIDGWPGATSSTGASSARPISSSLWAMACSIAARLFRNCWTRSTSLTNLLSPMSLSVLPRWRRTARELPTSMTLKP